MAPHAKLISLSLSQREPRPQLPWIANVPNALDLSFYPYHLEQGDYLLFLGRMSPDKGAHRAVKIALEAGLPLKIAGKCSEPAEQQYFDAYVRPHLGGDRRVRRRGLARREGRAAPARPRDRLPDRVAGAVRARDDRVDGLRDAGDRDPLGRGAGGDRPRRTGIIVDDGGRWRLPSRPPTRSTRGDARDVEERFTPERMVADYIAAYEAAVAAG